MIFLSHSCKNKSAARQIVEALALEGLPAWLDEQQLTPGVKLRPLLHRSIASSSIFLYLVSDYANNSQWVQDELAYALGLEFESKIQIFPVCLVDDNAGLPQALSGRLYHSLNTSRGGVSSLAHKLKALPFATTVPIDCKLSATVRLERYQLIHTLSYVRAFGLGENVHFLLLNEHYEELSELYWQVSDVKFPSTNANARTMEDVAKFISGIHAQTKSIICEIRLLCMKFIKTPLEHHFRSYYESAVERAIWVLMHRLIWNSEYLRKLKHEEEMDEIFLHSRDFHDPFCGYHCDFVAGNYKLVAPVPKGCISSSGTSQISWGMISPFVDMVHSDVGKIIGHAVAMRFLAKTLPSAEIPKPEELKYGLS